MRVLLEALDMAMNVTSALLVAFPPAGRGSNGRGLVV